MIYNLGLRFNSLIKKNRNRVAIIINNKKISFSTLNNQSNRICKWLISKGFKKNDIICISSDKSFFNYYLIIALIKLGITYVILDRKSPILRIQKIINQVQPKAIILDRKTGIHKIKLKKIIFKKEINLKGTNTRENDVNIEISKVPSSSIAYLMFTSGSTGTPKGVAISHSKLLFFSDWCKKTYDINSKDRLTNVNSLFFDNSVFDVFGGLFNGACLLPLSRTEIINPIKSLKYLNQNKPTIWFSVPSLILYFQKFNIFNQKKISSLKKIIFGGEGFPKKNLKKLYSDFNKKTELFNVYGPTECTCICSSYKITKFDFNKKEMAKFAPFGRRMANNFKFLILNNAFKKVKDGQVGELFIGGDNVGNGYFNLPEETKKKFIQNPLHNKFIDIYYKTGDLVYQDKKSKLIYFSSRKDNQIKLSGYRIELDEIENNINLIKGIKECAVTFGKKNKENEITAWVDTKLSNEIIFNKLSKKIPNYMMPKKIFKVISIPKNANGKVDRKILKKKYYD